ncbi:hypothetical protein FHY03_001822 [Sphingomonas sp. BK345]|nr:hypothetical protein [Sphingomonas sp. BK345]
MRIGRGCRGTGCQELFGVGDEACPAAIAAEMMVVPAMRGVVGGRGRVDGHAADRVGHARRGTYLSGMVVMVAMMVVVMRMAAV